MKTNIFRIGKKSLSLIVVMMLVISTMLVGMVSVNATITGYSAIYFTPNTNWRTDKAIFKLEADGTKYDFVCVDETNHVYKATLNPSSSYNNLKFLRINPDKTSETWNYSNTFSWIDSDTTKNNYVMNEGIWSNWNVDSSNGTWQTYDGGSSSTTYYLGGRIKQTENNSDWLDSNNTDYPFVPTETPGLYKYESSQTADGWSEARNGYPQYFFVHTGSGKSWYGSQPDTDANVPATLTAANQSISLKEYASDIGTDITRLTCINSADTTENVIFYLDTNNGMSLYYATASTPSTKYSISKGTETNGTFTVSSTSAEKGETITVKTSPAENHAVDTVTYTPDGGSPVSVSGSNNTYTFTMPAANVTVNVTFKSTVTPSPKYSISKGTETNGTFTVSSTSAEKDETITVNTSPDENYVVDTVTYTPDGGSAVSVSGSDNTYTFTMPAANVTVNVIFKSATPSVLSKPTVKVYAADGKTEISSVEAGSAFVIKATSSDSGVVYRLYKDGAQIGTDQSDGIFEITTDESMIGSTLTYTAKAVLNGKESAASDPVSVTVGEKAGIKTVRIWFKSSSATAYVPSFAIDNGTASVMSRDKKTSTDNGTYFGETFSGSMKFYWYYKDVTLDTSVAHKISFTTRGFRVNATDTYTFGVEDNYYFAVNNIMSDTKLIDLTGKAEYIRNYHISATHMVFAEVTDQGVGFTWVNGTEYPMGVYLEENNVAPASLNTLTSATNLLTIPSALTPTAMLKASSTPAFFTVKSATLAQKISAEISQVSELQYQLLDVNLDGVVDVRDSTMMQKALVYA